MMTSQVEQCIHRIWCVCEVRARRGAVYAPLSFRSSSSGSLAMFAATRRASSVVNRFANDLPQEARLALRLCWFE
jgi:hypothetical protein